MIISFQIPGQPIAKGRPRFARRGNFTVAYTPEKTVGYENLVKFAAAEAMAGAVPSEKPISLELLLELQIPMSWSKAKQERAKSGAVRATKKPDADNVLKAIKDACNGIVWRDDAQVVDITIKKLYAVSPCARVFIHELVGDPA